MSRIEISGIGVEYELLGDAGAPAITLTPGGRFPKDTPGLPQLARKLADGGRRVLLWDRPNCGASDISFNAQSESGLHADTLVALIEKLKLGPATIAGGSAGSRVSILAASRAPELTAGLAMWWISGGIVGLMNLGVHYSFESAAAAASKGMQAVAAVPGWAQQIERNPRNRDIILSQDPEQFVETMQRWASFFIPASDSPIPGMTPADFKRLTMPVLIFQNGKSDLSHTRRTTEWTHELIPGSKLVPPPWGDEEWNERCVTVLPEGPGLFSGWPALAPALLEFSAKR